MRFFFGLQAVTQAYSSFSLKTKEETLGHSLLNCRKLTFSSWFKLPSSLFSNPFSVLVSKSVDLSRNGGANEKCCTMLNIRPYLFRFLISSFTKNIGSPPDNSIFLVNCKPPIGNVHCIEQVTILSLE